MIVEDVKNELRDKVQEKQANRSHRNWSGNVIPFQFRQLMYNLISNALKFSDPALPSHIRVYSRVC